MALDFPLANHLKTRDCFHLVEVVWLVGGPVQFCSGSILAKSKRLYQQGAKDDVEKLDKFLFIHTVIVQDVRIPGSLSPRF